MLRVILGLLERTNRDRVLYKTLIDRYCPADIAKDFAPNGRGVDSSRDYSRVDRVLFETHDQLIASVRIDTDSYQDSALWFGIDSYKVPTDNDS